MLRAAKGQIVSITAMSIFGGVPMNIKYNKPFLPLLLATSLFAFPAAQASENEAVFINAQGMLVIPHLNLGNEIYYVQLRRMNPQTFDFRLIPGSVTKITPNATDKWAAVKDIVGDWVIEVQPAVSLTFEADGSYKMSGPADEDCVAGGETGTWNYDADTGVVTFKTVTDTNGDCGLSHPEGVARIKTSGAKIVVIINEPTNGIPTPEEVTLIRK
jgi:hypothetical protein